MWIEQRIVVAAFLFALGGSGYAQSQSQFHDIYFGVGAGMSKAKDPADCSPPPGFTTTACDIQDKKTGWRVFFGYQVNPYLAFEAGYADLGKFKTALTWSFVIPSPPVNVSTTFHTTVYGVDAVGTLPVGAGGFALLGRIGYFHWTLDAVTSAPFLPGIIGPGEEKPKGYNVDIGVGAKWDFSKNLGARLEYTRYPKVGDAESTGKSDVDLLSVSLLYRF